ncbi:hypothetical protein Hanom_Chr12g01148231 [Helianthus anomalus]
MNLQNLRSVTKIFVTPIELQVLSFIFIPNCRCCPLSLKLTSFVLNVLKSCMLCPLSLTQLDFSVKSNNTRAI